MLAHGNLRYALRAQNQYKSQRSALCSWHRRTLSWEALKRERPAYFDIPSFYMPSFDMVSLAMPSFDMLSLFMNP